MNEERLNHHHRRIRRKARLAHWTLVPLALAVPLAWLYFAVGRCQEAESAADAAACRRLGAVPFLPGLLGLAVAALIVFDLIELGRDWHHDAHGFRPVKRQLKHARHGYRVLDRRHRRHVHRALFEAAAASLGVAAWLLFEWFTTTH